MVRNILSFFDITKYIAFSFTPLKKKNKMQVQKKKKNKIKESRCLQENSTTFALLTRKQYYEKDAG